MKRILDLFCCGGGAGMGYSRAGFMPYGVDIEPQPNYPFPIYVGDAIDALTRLLAGERLPFTHPDGTVEWLGLADFVAGHASPPCQPYSTGVSSSSSPWVPTLGKDEPALIGAVHGLLVQTGLPWVIENVMGARPHMPQPWFILCGSMFGRPIPRHRVFATSFYTLAPAHETCRGLAQRSAAELGWEYRDMSVTGKGRRAGTSERWAYLLGITWPMTQHQLAEAIPPAYTEHIGRELLAYIESEAAA